VPESLVQLQPESTGKKQRSWDETIGSDTVHTHPFFAKHNPTYVINTDRIAGSAAGKVYAAVFNATGSGKTIRIIKAGTWNTGTATITGGTIGQKHVYLSAMTADGTAITPVKLDTGDADLPSQITARHSCTVTDASAPELYFFHEIQSDETRNIITTPDSHLTLHAHEVAPPYPIYDNIWQYPTLPENTGFALKQGTQSTAASISAAIIFEVY
jgi:hypothetical protein